MGGGSELVCGSCCFPVQPATQPAAVVVVGQDETLDSDRGRSTRRSTRTAGGGVVGCWGKKGERAAVDVGHKNVAIDQIQIFGVVTL